MNIIRFLVFIPTLSFAIGCGEVPADESAGAVEQAAMDSQVASSAAALSAKAAVDQRLASESLTADAAALVGTFESPEGKPDYLPFYVLTLNSDGTYSALGGCRPGGVHCHAITHTQGKWSVGKSGPQLGAPAGLPELRLVGSTGADSVYFYSQTGRELALSTSTLGAKSIFEKR
jgi:hypothetical protein